MINPSRGGKCLPIDSIVKEHERGFGSALVFMVFFPSSINHSSANLLFAVNLEASDFDTYLVCNTSLFLVQTF
jgi:hypothetical protein